MLSFLIDGYNLLHAAGLAGVGRVGRWEKARTRLLDWIADAAHVKAGTARLLVVFDAQHGTGDGGERTHRGAVRVRFAYKQTADDLIESLLAAERIPAAVAVVSNDTRLRESARRRGAAGWSCEAFIDWLATGTPGPGETTPPRPTSPEKPTGPTPPAERDELLRAFLQKKRGH